LRENGTGEDVLKATLHASYWDSIQKESLCFERFTDAYTSTQNIFPYFLAELKEMDWKMDALVFTDNGIRISW
jgi:hypothetical protein